MIRPPPRPPLFPYTTPFRSRVSRRALLKGEIQLTSLILRQGRFTWPLNEAQQPPQLLQVDGIMTELRFLPNDQWELDHFQRSEEHTSELQSLAYLVCRLLLE